MARSRDGRPCPPRPGRAPGDFVHASVPLRKQPSSIGAGSSPRRARGNGPPKPDLPRLAPGCARPSGIDRGGSPRRGRRAVRDRLPDLAAAHASTSPPTSSAPTCSARGLHDLERQVVRRPPHARLQRAVPAAGAGCSSPQVAGAIAAVASRRAVRAARARPLRRRARALGRALVRRRRRHAAVHRPAAVRARRRLRPRRAARAAAPPHACWRSCWRCCARSQPGRRPLPRARGAGLRGRAARDRASGARACDRGRALVPPVFLVLAPSPRAAARRSRSPPTCRSRCSRSPALLVLPREQSAARGARCSTGSARRWRSLLDTPMGGNAVRLGALFGGPLLAVRAAVAGASCGSARAASRAARRTRALAVVPAGARRRSRRRGPGREGRLLRAAARSSSTRCPTSAGSRSRSRAPLGGRRGRAARPLARGWQRQLDTGRNPIFYGGPLNRADLRELAAPRTRVRYVALPERQARQRAPTASAALIERGLPYLQPRWKSEHWRVYEVTLPAPLVISAGRRADIRLEQLGSDELLLDVARARARRSCACAGRPTGRRGRLRGARRRLDARDRRAGRASCAVDPLRAGAARPARSPLRLDDRLRLKPCRRTHPLCTQLARAWRLSSRWLPTAGSTRSASSLLFAGAYYLYRIVRGMVDGQAALAFENARDLVDVERSLGLFFEPGLQAWAQGHALDRRRRELDVRELALRDHDDVPDLALPRAQPRLLLRAQHVHGRDGPRARRLHRLPDRAAALPARVGLQRHRRELRRRGAPSRARTCSTTRSPPCRACTWPSR